MLQFIVTEKTGRFFGSDFILLPFVNNDRVFYILDGSEIKHDSFATILGSYRKVKQQLFDQRLFIPRCKLTSPEQRGQVYNFNTIIQEQCFTS